MKATEVRDYVRMYHSDLAAIKEYETHSVAVLARLRQMLMDTVKEYGRIEITDTILKSAVCDKVAFAVRYINSDRQFPEGYVVAEIRDGNIIDRDWRISGIENLSAIAYAVIEAL